MAYTLRDLIKASGNAGTSGQSFRNHVTGATSGTAMSHYKAGLAFDVTDALPSTEYTYASGSSVYTRITYLSTAVKWSLIRQNGTTPWTQIGSSSTTGGLRPSSVVWDDTGLTGTANYTLIGVYDPNTLQTLSYYDAWFRDYPYPNQPPDSGTYVVRAKPVATGSLTPSGSSTMTYQWQYVPDIGPFNPTYTDPTSITVAVSRIAYPAWATVHESEYYSDSGYTTLVGNTISSDPETIFTWWIRYRIKAEYNGGTPGSWNYYGSYTWYDPRPDT